MGEEWKSINERYEVSNLGNVRSVDFSPGPDSRGRNRFKKGVLLKPGLRPDGYLVVNVSKFRHKKNWKIHQLVAIHFLENPYNLPSINHKNGDKFDNRASNLEWCTQSWNIKHSYDVLGRKAVGNFGEANGYSKRIISASGVSFPSINAAADQYGIKASTLQAMLRGQNRNKTDLTYAVPVR